MIIHPPTPGLFMADLAPLMSSRVRDLPLFIHPILILRFGYFQTQPLEILSADSVHTSLKCNPTLGTNIGQRILGMRTGCMAI